MAVTKQKKGEQLKALIDMFGKSKSVVFTAYKGLDVKTLTDMRKSLRKGKGEFKVAKKTLIKKAADENKIEGIEEKMMEGQVGAAFSYDDILSGIKVVFKFAKDSDKVQILGGVIDGKVVTADVVKQYAKLPSREELLAKFMGSAQSPVQGTVGLLSNLLSSFVRAVNALREKNEKAGA